MSRIPSRSSYRFVFVLPAVLPALLLALIVSSTGCAKKPAPQVEEAAPAVDPAPSAPAVTAEASATLASKDGSIHGMVSFTETADGVAVVAHVEGAPPGVHGFHIHETGDCSADDFTSAGGHFNPAGVPHGGPDDVERHGGDLGNIEVAEGGHGHLEISSDIITLGEGANSVIGRGVILHADADDLVSQPTGAAGARLACGVIHAGS